MLVLAAALAAPPLRADDSGEGRKLIQEYGLRETAEPFSRRAGWRRPTRIVVDANLVPLLPRLRAAAPGLEIVSASSPDEMAREVASGAQGAIGRQAFVCSPQVLTAGTALSWVQTMSAGVENCDRVAAQLRSRSIVLTNMRALTGPPIAEHSIALMFALARGLHVSIPRQSSGNWSSNYGDTPIVMLRDRTLLVVGLGGIGSEVAKRGAALGMRVTATRGTRQPRPAYVAEVGLPEDLPRLIAAADFVVHTAPLTEATRGLYDARMFARMKPTAYFINVARGGAVVTDALLEALNTKRIAGAALDVTDPEPLPPEHPLWRAPNIIITPHMSNLDGTNAEASQRVAVENLRRFVAGGRLLSPVDLERGY